MNAPFRIGIIGLGGFAGAHHERVLQLEAGGHARLVATCDPRADAFAAQQAAWDFARRGVRVFADYREMIAACRHELDLLVIPTPIALHAEMHRAGVEAGLAVYLEKPPTLDYLELETMIDRDQAAPKASLVGFNFIVEEPRQALKQRLLAGEFGRLREAHLAAEWARPASYFRRNGWAGRLHGPDGRVILDSCFGNAMAHYVHNLLFWAGEDTLYSWGQPRTVEAELYRAHEIEGADTFFVESRTAGGVTLRFALTHACRPPSTQSETLICEKATLRYIVHHQAEIRWHDGRVETIKLGPFDSVTANHLAYYRYLRGEFPRPATTLADSRPFVNLNNLAYVSSGEITPLPAAAIHRVKADPDQQDYLAVAGLAEAFESFLAHGRRPGAALGWRTAPPALVTPDDLARFHETLRSLAGESPAGATDLPLLANS